MILLVPVRVGKFYLENDVLTGIEAGCIAAHSWDLSYSWSLALPWTQVMTKISHSYWDITMTYISKTSIISTVLTYPWGMFITLIKPSYF